VGLWGRGGFFVNGRSAAPCLQLRPPTGLGHDARPLPKNAAWHEDWAQAEPTRLQCWNHDAATTGPGAGF